MRRWLSFIFALLATSALGHAPEPKSFLLHEANGSRTSLNPQPSTNRYSFDAYDRMTSHTNAEGYVLQYRYDPNGNLTSLIYPGNRTVTYAYDSLNRLTDVWDWRVGNNHTILEYDLASRVRKITRPNGTFREIHYDDAGQTTNILEKMAIGVPIAFYKLNWNAAGRMEWEFAAPLPHSNAPPTRTMYFDADNRMTNFNGQSIVHDTDGNLTSGPLTNNTLVTYAYDARNRLLSAGGLNYGYDPAGHRTAITNGANVTRLVVNPNAALSQVLMRVRPGVTNYYIYGLGLLYEITETATTTTTATYHYDYRGSTVALTDGNGLPTGDRIEYSTYGTITYRTGTNDTPFLYNGRYGVQTDPNGLLHMRARYYNPHLCRFINSDPIGFDGGLNFYAYADGDPVSMMDPFGLGAIASGGQSWISQTLAGTALGDWASGFERGLQSWAAGEDLNRYTWSGSDAHLEGIGSGYNAVPNLVEVASFIATAGIVGGPTRAVAAKSAGILGPKGPGQFVMRGGGSLHSTVAVRQGTLVNRVFDSGFAANARAAQPLGRYFGEGGTLPSSAGEAIAQRGLNLRGIINNARMGATSRANAHIPALRGPAAGGTGTELIIDPNYFKYLGLQGGYIPLP